MKTVTGIFPSRSTAESASHAILSLGVPHERMNFLIPGATEKELRAVPTEDGEQPGMGMALGAVVGGAAGASAGVSLVPIVASLLIPGVGPVLAIGAVGAMLLGAAGAVGGALAGKKAEEALSEGLPHDELYLYEDALRKGHTVLIVLAENDSQSNAVWDAMVGAGAEELDAAREQWWIGLRDAEAAEYSKSGGDFRKDEELYRMGFKAALHPVTRGTSRAEVDRLLREKYAEASETEAFGRGYDRGLAYSANLTHKKAS